MPCTVCTEDVLQIKIRSMHITYLVVGNQISLLPQNKMPKYLKATRPWIKARPSVLNIAETDWRRTHPSGPLCMHCMPGVHPLNPMGNIFHASRCPLHGSATDKSKWCMTPDYYQTPRCTFHLDIVIPLVQRNMLAEQPEFIITCNPQQ